MKILFIVDVDENNKAGLFMAVHNRIKALIKQQNVDVVEVYNLKGYDYGLIKFIKRIKGQDVQEQEKLSFRYDGVLYENKYIKNSLMKKILLKMGIDFLYYKKLIYELSVGNFDIISAHWGDAPGSMAFHIKKYKKVPYTLTLHGSDIHTMPYNDKIYRKILLRNLRNADASFFVSQQLKLDAEKIGWKENYSKSYVSYNAVDKSMFFPLSTLEICEFKEKEKTENIVVGFVGNLVEIKRADYLIDIYSEIQSKVSEKITFFIIGEGPLKEGLLIDERHKSLDIRIIGRIAHENVREYLSIMKCLILPSINEGTPNIVLEAQACGIPVVATNVGGISEVISNRKNLVVNDENTLISEFASKVKKIINIESGVEWETFTWEKIVEKELHIYKKICN